MRAFLLWDFKLTEKLLTSGYTTNSLALTFGGPKPLFKSGYGLSWEDGSRSVNNNVAVTHE